LPLTPSELLSTTRFLTTLSQHYGLLESATQLTSSIITTGEQQAPLRSLLFFLFFIAYDRQQILVSALAVVTAGATAGFLIWNRHPAKIYMGDAGSLFLGIIISVLTIRLSPGVVPTYMSLAIPVILMATPILDTSVAVFLVFIAAFHHFKVVAITSHIA
jgi:UDP-N-acetylmuramyl pentapeptide phosphotransferase/UDP-N-acetylglucosamine-1-phosphate transferase